MPKEGVRIKKATLASHFYSKKYRRFYRFPGPYLLTEVPIQETNS